LKFRKRRKLAKAVEIAGKPEVAFRSSVNVDRADQKKTSAGVRDGMILATGCPARMAAI
jgi:hypothetical protein